MNKTNAIRAMLDGEEVRHVSWPKDHYISYDKDSQQFVTSDGFLVQLSYYPNEGWAAYKKPKPTLDTRVGDFACDLGKNWFFQEDPNGYWLEVDIKEHRACVYICVKFDNAPYATPYGQRVLDAINKEFAE